ncbi:carbohydrate kinase family protein [soil metagenome]
MKKRSADKRSDLVVFGEFFSDMVFYNLPDRPRLGEEIKTDSFLIAPGGLATTAQAANRLGTSTAIITRVGADAASLPTWLEILRQGFDVSACETSDSLPTALTVCVAYNADRMMVTHEPIHHNLEALLEKPEVQRKLRSARHVHLACALRQPKKWLPLLKLLRSEGITVSADFGWNPDVPAEDMSSILRHLEFVFPNEHEARKLTGAKSAKRALEKLAEWVRVPVITLGDRGAMLLADGKLHTQPALAQTLVDATGAGDAFNGGFLHGFLKGWGWDDCLRAGNICGGMAVSAPGGSEGLPAQALFQKHLQAMQG